MLNASSWFLNTCYSVSDDIGGPQPGPFLVNVMGVSLQSLPLPLPPRAPLHATIQHSLSLNGKGAMVAKPVCLSTCVYVHGVYHVFLILQGPIFIIMSMECPPKDKNTNVCPCMCVCAQVCVYMYTCMCVGVYTTGQKF